MKCARRCSSSVAAFSRISARIPAGVLLQASNPRRAAVIASFACSGVASITVPTVVVGSMGLTTCRAAPALVSPLMRGAAVTGAVSAAIAASSSSKAERSPNSMPREFCRCGCKRSRGRGMFGCRALLALPMISAGRRSSVATGTLSSAAIATNDELAPFSNSRRTR